MITYDAIETEQAVKIFENNLDFWGKVQSIEHQRLKFETLYKTTIIGSEETLVINNGLSSGYAGEGPRGLYRVLEKLGIESADAKFYVTDRDTHKKGFTLKF